MKIEPSGVVMKGLCMIQSAKCKAKDQPGPLTAVWGSPGRRQLDVCGACLAEMIATGQWESDTPSLLPRLP